MMILPPELVTLLVHSHEAVGELSAKIRIWLSIIDAELKLIEPQSGMMIELTAGRPAWSGP